MSPLRFRSPEWLLIGFFSYIAILSAFFRDRPSLHYQPLLLLAVITLGLSLLSQLERAPFALGVGIVRDWLPLVLTFIAFREMELFLPSHYGYGFEDAWIRWDIIVLHNWRLRAIVESLGVAVPFYLELCYFLVYGVGAFCLGIVVLKNDRTLIDRFLTVYLAGTLLAYALFPYFPSQPPRYAFPDIDPPTVITWLRRLNLWLLGKATIHSGVFPSAHVSAAFSSAWGLFLILPKKKRFGWCMLVYAFSVSIATIYGRYHYVADAVAGFAVSLLAALVCVCLLPSRQDARPIIGRIT